jgi:hypothetical protein
VIVLAGQSAVHHQRAVDLLHDPPVRLRDEVFALVSRVAADDFNVDVQQGTVDEDLVLEALVHQGLVQTHSALLGSLVERAVPAALSWADAASTTTPMISPTTSTASPRLRPDTFLLASSPVVVFGTPAAARTDWVSVITRDGSSNRRALSRTGSAGVPESAGQGRPDATA